MLAIENDPSHIVNVGEAASTTLPATVWITQPPAIRIGILGVITAAQLNDEFAGDVKLHEERESENQHESRSFA